MAAEHRQNTDNADPRDTGPRHVLPQPGPQAGAPEQPDPVVLAANDDRAPGADAHTGPRARQPQDHLRHDPLHTQPRAAEQLVGPQAHNAEDTDASRPVLPVAAVDVRPVAHHIDPPLPSVAQRPIRGHAAWQSDDDDSPSEHVQPHPNARARPAGGAPAQYVHQEPAGADPVDQGPRPDPDPGTDDQQPVVAAGIPAEPRRPVRRAAGKLLGEAEQVTPEADSPG